MTDEEMEKILIEFLNNEKKENKNDDLTEEQIMDVEYVLNCIDETRITEEELESEISKTR